MRKKSRYMIRRNKPVQQLFRSQIIDNIKPAHETVFLSSRCNMSSPSAGYRRAVPVVERSVNSTRYSGLLRRPCYNSWLRNTNHAAGIVKHWYAYTQRVRTSLSFLVVL